MRQSWQAEMRAERINVEDGVGCARGQLKLRRQRKERLVEVMQDSLYLGRSEVLRVGEHDRAWLRRLRDRGMPRR